MSFGDRLRVLIEDRDMTQRELAAALNVAPSTMGNYVQNTREPDFATLKAIADYFDVSADYLLERRTGEGGGAREAELLRVFRGLSPSQQELYLEQGRAFIRVAAREKGGSSPSPGHRAG